jgi:hypothetical protein
MAVIQPARQGRFIARELRDRVYPEASPQSRVDVLDAIQFVVNVGLLWGRS